MITRKGKLILKNFSRILSHTELESTKMEDDCTTDLTNVTTENKDTP